MITCVALDPDIESLDKIKALCQKFPEMEVAAAYTNPSEAAQYIRTFPVDVILMEINLPFISGFDFYRSLAQSLILIIATTTRESAFEAFEVAASDYLLKPIIEQRFRQTIQKIQNQILIRHNNSRNNEQNLIVRSEYSLVKIPFRDILYLETLDDYVKIHQFGKKPVLTLSSLRQIIEKLPENEFVRVHRSYVVAINKVDSVRGKTITTGAAEIPIGAKYEAEFFSRYVTTYS